MDNETSEDITLENSDAEELQLTPKEVIELMQEAWINERFSPEILPHKSEIVDCLLEQINHMEENIQMLDSANFQRAAHQMEVDRLRYIITSYLRTRLQKIEMFVFNIINQEQQRIQRQEDAYLTESEFQFAREYQESLEHHFQNVMNFRVGIPPDDWKSNPVSPNLHSFVFLKSKAEIEGVIIDDGNDEENDLVDLKEGSQMLLSYNSIAGLLKTGSVQLL